MYHPDHVKKYIKSKPKDYIRKIHSLRESYVNPEQERKINNKYKVAKTYEAVNAKFNMEIFHLERKILTILHKRYPHLQDSTITGKVNIPDLIKAEIKTRIEPFPDKKKAILQFCDSKVIQEMLFEDLFNMIEAKL
jgi:hypothetical protein